MWVAEPGFWLTLLAALPVGLFAGWWAARLIVRDRKLMDGPVPSRSERRRWIIRTGLVYVVLCCGLYFVTTSGGLATPEVQPSAWGLFLRRCYHQILISLILVATVVDWDGYTIPDQITFPGMFVGLAGASLVGELQLIHLWVDWNQAIPELRGPYLPDWFDRHRHWHGLAWSAAGLAVGAGLTWLVRAVSSRLMGRETLGFGDVTFMAMIGSFLGWQPAVCAFFIAPLLGLVVGVPLKLLTNKPYIPYGPFLGIGALVTMFAWGPLWGRTKGIFGDGIGLVILAACSGAGFVLLLGLMQVYRSIPVRSERKE